MFKVTYNNQTKEFSAPIKVQSLLDKNDYSAILSLVNNRARELTYEINRDSMVEFLKLDNEEASRVYEASLRYLFAMAAKNIYPEYRIKFNYSIARGIFVQILNYQIDFSEEIITNIDKEMKRLIKKDLPIVRKVVINSEAKNIYLENGYLDKISILSYRPERTVHLYECGGYLNYMYSHMVPSTGYLKTYQIKKYNKGAILLFPRAEKNGGIVDFADEKTFASTLNSAGKWARTISAETIAQINSHVINKTTADFVSLCETKHNSMLYEIGSLIESNKEKIKLIAIAGPSSSGKTTFSHRLRIELMTRGITPITLSIDDYYLNREDLKPEEDGKIDLEHLNTIDIKLFNKHLVALTNGEEVEIPSFNFKKGKREKGQKLRLPTNSPLIIEGIHALNRALTTGIKRENQFKIYIAPHIQINLDDHNPISITQFRLLRRLVRDYKFRGFDALKTFEIWDSVRQGEFRWIYQHQEDVDYVFNSQLSYELGVIKKHAMPLLNKIDKDSPNYMAANKIVKFLKLFKDIPDNLVPNNSLLREFIGSSIFHDL